MQLWVSKRRKSRPQLDTASSDLGDKPPVPLSPRRGSLGSTRLPFAPIDPQGPASEREDMSSRPQNLYGRPILTMEEQQSLARESPSPPNFSLPRRDSSRPGSSSGSSPSPSRSNGEPPDQMYARNSLASFSFGSTSIPPPQPSIGPLEEEEEYDYDERRMDETPRPSLANTARGPGRDPRTPANYYVPPNTIASDAASHHTFGTSSTSSLSSPSPTRSRTTSSTTHTSVSTPEDLGGVTFGMQYQPPPPPPSNLVHYQQHHPGVEFDSEEDEFSEDYDGDAIEVSSQRGGGSAEAGGYDLEAVFERQMYSAADSLSLFGGRRPSLPMAIPGAPPDERREREGSIATVRRGSRSLETPGSVLGAGSPPSTTVSVPETGGDWRSLSARSAASSRAGPAHPSPPTISVVPTFAEPPDSASGMDGFGFDADWNAMQGGITGLDMSDIAVYSTIASPSSSTSAQRRPSNLSSILMRRGSTASQGSGSLMLDPDTFAAAVRSWGGDEYEKQRKHWTFRKDTADGRGARSGVALGPVKSITQGKTGSKVSSSKGSVLSGSGGGDRPKYAQWRGMSLNQEEIWNSSLVGGFKVRRIELRPQKPQQRVTIDPFRSPYIVGPKPPHDGAYTNIHKHSKVMAFSIHRHYKPVRVPPGAADTLSRTSTNYGRGSVSGASHTGSRGSVSVHGSRTGQGPSHEEHRRPTAMILLAPRHVQEAYTSTNTTKGLRSHGLLDEGRDRDRDRDRSSGRDREREDGRRRERERDRSRSNGAGPSTSSSQVSSSGSTTHRDNNWQPTNHTYPPPVAHVSDGREGAVPHLPRPASRSRRRRRNSLDIDSDSETDRTSSRTTHNEAFSTMDASLIDQLQSVAETRGDSSNRVFSPLALLRRGQTHATGPTAPYNPPWVTLQSRGKQEERRRRHDVLSNSFEDVGLLPPKKSTGGSRLKKSTTTGVDIFAQVPSEALFMLLPLWPGPTDPVSERSATRPPQEISTDQRQYLLVAYKPTEERLPPKKQDESSGRSKKGSSHSSPTSSADNGNGGRGCDILLTSYVISARLVSHADLQGSGVRVPDEGLAVLGPWEEAYISMPQIATKDHGLLVIGTCTSREGGIQFIPEGLLKMGLCVPALSVPGAEDEEPVAELTPIGKAVLEMAWIGCVAVSSFGPAAST
ncbi:hypothetical protein FB45DRAFT_1051459 [Roridomyces roridus]|uniref:Uncharacterized protein n=1 Tax=Roridomyces roridus TaxID=1738132 RepID=A0AAD7FW63_9AGAR|nr:hypothetical protein FB45DRAFT_1051459 [Roridomyces roridus]